MNRQRIVTMMTLPLLALALVACARATPAGSERPSAYPTLTPAPSSADNQDAAFAAAQATLVASQSEMMALSHRATVVNLNLNQAANAAAQATIDYHQRQLMELSIQATEVSQIMAWAAATQQSIADQAQMAWNATATAQSQAATATHSAYILSITKTAQAQAILDVRVAETAQANATLTAYSLTATPWAALQTDISRMRNEKIRRAWWEDFVVNPLKAILYTLVVVSLIVGGALTYQRLVPALELRLRTISRPHDSPLLLVDSTIVDSDPYHHRFTPQALGQIRYYRLEAPHVDIIGPSEPSVAHWIAEAERKLRADGWIQP